MQLNVQMEGSKNGGSEQASSSDDGQLLEALRKMMKKEIELMVIKTVQQVIGPTIEDWTRKVVKEEIQLAEKKLLTGETRNYANERTMSKEISLQLKFLDEVSVPVLTGKVINGKGGNSIRVALVDRATAQIVKCGPESSATVEILVLDASGDDKEHNWTHENFNNRIIREGDKKKPHFAKSVYVCLEEGVGILNNAKLGHDSYWMKSCKCRLGARIMENFRGIEVQEACTESFMVSDKRSGFYVKHHSPSLSDEVWRLKNIGRDGAPCKRLKKENISTVRDFLFLHSVHPQRLQQIVGAGAKTWKATVDHAWTCNIDDKRMYLYYPSTESKMGVIFDAVGRLKGVIQESHYVPMNNLSADKKDCAHKLLLSAFENQKDITSFDDEASLLKRFPCRSSDINAATNSSIQEGSNGCDLSISENINGCHPTGPGTPSQSISPDTSTSDHPNNISHFESTNTGQLYDANLSVLIKVPSCQSSDLENINKCAPRDPGTSSQSIGPSIRTFELAEKRIFKDGNQTSAGSNMKLKFRNRISQEILTGEEIKGEGNTPIEVALVDDPTGNIVDVGAEASASVEIVLLKGKPDDASQEDEWTVEEFNENIVPEMEGKMPLLAGNVPLKLQRGIGVLKNIKFRHHARKIKPSVFKLGARVVDASDGGRILYYPSTESKMGVIFDAVGILKGVIQESHYVPMNNLSADKKDCAHKLLLSAFENQKDITSFDDEASLLKRFPCRSSDINAATNSSIQEGSNGCDLSISENINGCHPTGPGTPSQSISPDTSTSDHPNNISHFGSLGSQTIGQLYDAHSGVHIRRCQSLDLDSILDKLFVENRNLMSLLNPEINNRSLTLRAKSNSHLPNNIFHCDSLGSPNMGQLLYETPLDVPKIPSCKFSYPDFILEASGDNWRRMYVVKSEINKSETLRAESHSHQQSNSRFFRLVRLVVNVNLWVDRAKKRVLALEGLRVHKKQKIVRDLNLLADTASEVG